MGVHCTGRFRVFAYLFFQDESCVCGTRFFKNSLLRLKLVLGEKVCRVVGPSLLMHFQSAALRLTHVQHLAAAPLFQNSFSNCSI